MRALVTVVVAGCYSPALLDGQMCSETGHCPEGLACDPNTNTCVSRVVHCALWDDFGAPTTLVNLRVANHSLNSPWLSPDMLRLWYTDDNADPHAYRSRREPGGEFPAGEPHPELDDLNGTNGQLFESDDQLTLYYNDPAIRVMRRTRKTPLDEFVATGERVFPMTDASDAAVTADDLEMVVAVPVVSNAADLQLSTRASIADEWPLPDGAKFSVANAPNDDDCCASISGDGLEVIFESSRIDGQALWRTTRATRSDVFGPAEKLVGQPVLAANASPTLSRDGTTLVYASKPDGQPIYDIVIAERTCLQSD